MMFGLDGIRNDIGELRRASNRHETFLDGTLRPWLSRVDSTAECNRMQLESLEKRFDLLLKFLDLQVVTRPAETVIEEARHE